MEQNCKYSQNDFPHHFKLRKTGFFFLLVLLLSITSISNSYAQTTTACDPQYMDALEARAWLEAQREITQNQNLIVKPDSVLEYSCFDRFLSAVAKNFGNRPFSEVPTSWGPVATINSEALDNSLDQVVGLSLKNYLENNFGHTYLGGRSDQDYALMPQGSIIGADYVCNEMFFIWNAARCTNFADKEEQDSFFDFSHYMTTDPRKFPSNMPNCTAPGAGYNRNLREAYNNEPSAYTLVPDNNITASGGYQPNIQGPYEQDPVQTHLEKTKAGSCEGLPIPTGIEVRRSDVSGSYMEHVCPNPGCFYDPNGGTCKPSF